MAKGRKDENPSLMHHYKAPHDYFENADRYESATCDIDIPEPKPVEKRSKIWFKHRGHNDELIPHIEIIGTGIQEGLIFAIYPVVFQMNPQKL